MEIEKEKFEKLRKLAYDYYSRKDIQKALIEQAKNKEVIPRYFSTFGKRPDTLEYSTDVINLAIKGATSFHCSEELWQNPLELNTNLKEEQLNKLRRGWNLILDIDCKFLEYSKIAAWLLGEALYFHGVHNFGLKFSGNVGFHIGLDFKAFPKEINKIKIKDFFPQGPRLIAAYLKDMITKDLGSRILKLSTLKEIAKATGKPIEILLDEEKKFNPFSILEIDTVLIAPRHLYRMAYSLHEKTGLVSVVIKPEQLKAFHPAWANPQRVYPKQFLPEPEQGEAKELLIQALDWQARKQERKEERQKLKIMKKEKPIGEIRERIKRGEGIKFEFINEEMFPPCIKMALKGMKYDGRKRALFILINFFRSINLDLEQIEKKISDWNKLNYKPLKENYIATQLQWFKRQDPRLPPNCNLNKSSWYKDIELCQPDGLCKYIKNPVNYVMLRARALEEEKEGTRKRSKRKYKRRK